jgi:hypothetical protein
VSVLLAVVVCVLSSLVTLLALVVVWRDDHRWLDRPRY